MLSTRTIHNKEFNKINPSEVWSWFETGAQHNSTQRYTRHSQLMTGSQHVNDDDDDANIDNDGDETVNE